MPTFDRDLTVVPKLGADTAVEYEKETVPGRESPDVKETVCEPEIPDADDTLPPEAGMSATVPPEIVTAP